MFGLIISGRPVNATPTAITETQYAFRIPSSGPTFNHIVLFLLPNISLPPGTAASVYIQLPTSTEFKFLGGIGPGKESAIFKVSGLGGANGVAGTEGDVDAMTDDDPASASASAAPTAAGGGEIVVGLSIEPAAQVEAQLLQLKAQSQANSSQATSSNTSSALVRTNGGGGGGDGKASTKVLAQRIIGNAFNFLASFGSDTVPLKAFEEWWRKFEKRVELDPGFLEREGVGG